MAMVTQIDHIEIIVQHFEEYVAMFRALGFRELTRTKHHGNSVELHRQVTLRHGPDLTVRTSQARVELEAGSASGDQPVEGQAPFGTLAGQGFRIAESGDNILVKGPAQLLVQPGTKPRLP